REDELLGAIALGEVLAEVAAFLARRVAVEDLLARGLGHPEVHVRRVGVPGQDDAQVESRRGWLGEVSALAGRDLVDLGEAAVPLASLDLREVRRGGRDVAEVGLEEGEIAEGLRLLGAQGGDALEDLEGERGLVELLEPVGEDTERRG